MFLFFAPPCTSNDKLEWLGQHKPLLYFTFPDPDRDVTEHS